MKKGRVLAQDALSSSGMAGMIKGGLEDFNQAIRSLAETRKSLEGDVTGLTGEIERLKREKAMFETDLAKAKEVSEAVMAARVAEEEKQDVLERNQELKSYLDSAADMIKGLEMKLAGEKNEVKRLHGRMEALEKEKLSAAKEKEQIALKAIRMSDMIKEQDLKMKELTIKLETQEDDKRSLEKELESTKKTLDEIQSSMVSIKEKMKKGGL